MAKMRFKFKFDASARNLISDCRQTLSFDKELQCRDGKKAKKNDKQFFSLKNVSRLGRISQ
jgi:hypothetical protein